MASKSDEEGLAKDLAQQASQQLGSIAHWLQEREPGDLVTEVKDFARRKPGTFLAVAAGIGLVAGRMTRGVKAGAPDQDTRPTDVAVTSPVRQDVTTPVSSVTSPGTTYGDARPGARHAQPHGGAGSYVGDPAIGEPIPSDTPTTGTTRRARRTPPRRNTRTSPSTAVRSRRWARPR